MELLDAILKRHSPRSLGGVVTDQMLNLLFEAARWAPSSNNEQEWSYYYVRKENAEAHEKLAACMVESNRVWASLAPVLMVSCGRKNFASKNRPNRHWMHDVGAANVSMALQAAEMGLQIHQMAGFHVEQCAEVLGLDLEQEEPVTMITIGFQKDPLLLPDVNGLREREVEPRVRRSQNEFVTELK